MLNFLQSLLYEDSMKSSVPHCPSEIILIFWLGAQHTFLIINVENSNDA